MSLRVESDGTGGPVEPVPRLPGHVCPTCDYDLSTLRSRVCPECGNLFTLADARRRARAIDDAHSVRSLGSILHSVAKLLVATIAGLVAVYATRACQHSGTRLLSILATIACLGLLQWLIRALGRL